MQAVILAVLFAHAVALGPGAEVRLIAHRGGVANAQHAENTLSSLGEAIRQGYWMVEVDVRRSRDGELVVLHDENFKRVYGVNKDVADMDWSEIRLLRSRIGGEAPCTFAEYAAQCRGKIGVMIDCKEGGADVGFFEKMEAILRDNKLLTDALFIGSGEMKVYFKGKARIGADRDGLKRAVDAGENAASLYFLFEHGNELDDTAVQYAQSIHVPIIPTVNDYHYLTRRRATTPQSDIERLRQAGVTEFQIDAAYAGFFK